MPGHYVNELIFDANKNERTLRMHFLIPDVKIEIFHQANINNINVTDINYQGAMS